MALLVHLPLDLQDRVKALLKKRREDFKSPKLSPADLQEAQRIADTKGRELARDFMREKLGDAALRPTQERLVLEIMAAGLKALESAS